jgi:hypothetical protein
MKNNKKSFDEKNDLITVRPKKIIEQVKTFHGESDFIVPRKHTYIDKKNNTIVSLARDNSHSSVDTVGEYANATNQPNACPQYMVNWGAQNMPNSNTQFIVDISNIGGGNPTQGVPQPPFTAYVTYTNSGNTNTQQIQLNNANIGSTVITGFPNSTGGVNGGTYTVSVSVSDANGCMGTPTQTTQNITLQGSAGATGATGATGGGGGIKGIKGQIQNQQVNLNTTITKNVTPLNNLVLNASSVILQPDTINATCTYQDGQAPYQITWKIADASGNVVGSQVNNVSSLQDSYTINGLSGGTYNVSVEVLSSDNSQGKANQDVTIKGITKASTQIQGKLKINNLNLTTTNPTTTGFDVNLTWSDGTSPFQVNATITNGTNAVTHQMPENSNSHSWTQPLIVDASGNTLYGTYAVDVVVTDAVGDSVVGNTSINIQAPKASPLTGQLVATNKQNASFDVDYKFANGVAPFSLTATLYYAPDASGNAQSFPLNQTNLNNTGIFPVVITPDANGNVTEGYYKVVNAVVTDANGQTANLNDLSVYLNGVKGAANVPTPPPATTTTTTTSTTTIVPMGGGAGGGGGEEPTAPETVVSKDKLGINWLLVIIALGVGYAIIRKKQ